MSLVWQSPKISGIFRIFDDKCLKIRGIATPVCALARNDRIFQTARQIKIGSSEGTAGTGDFEEIPDATIFWLRMPV